MTESDGPSIGIVVPVYRVEDWVVETLQSIRAQTVDDWECVVVDDGSPDASAERARTVISTEPRMRLVRQDNQGVSGARNTGLANLSTSVRYVAFLDSDDTWCPDALETLIAALQVDPDAVGSYGYAELMDERGSPLTPGVHPARQQDRRRISGHRLEEVPVDEPLTIAGSVVVGPIWPTAVALHRRSVVDAVGLFDTSFTHSEDWDFYHRMLRFGHFVVVQRQVAWYRQHSAQVTLSHLDASLNAERVRRKMWSSALNTPEQRRMATRTFRQLQFRHTARTAQRLLRALRSRQWREVPPLLAATIILAAQTVGPSYPKVTRRQLVWSRRTI